MRRAALAMLLAGCGHDAATSDAALADVMPPGTKRVFVTSQRYSADLRSAGGRATGLESADAIFQTHADAVTLGGTFRAWLSTTATHAIDHITGAGPWYRMDGALAFANRATLGTAPAVPIMYDEMRGEPDPFYESWTGTALGGHVAPPGARSSVTCLEWTSTVDSNLVGGLVGVYGDAPGEPEGDGAAWTDYAVGYCSPFQRHLYCFEE